MSAVNQPDMFNTDGVMITVGMATGADRWALTFPVGFSAGLDANLGCNDAVESFGTQVLPSILACISEDVECTFISGEAMVDGLIPFRHDYSPGDEPGLRATGVAPNQVAGLLVFYPDGRDLTPGNRTPVGKNFIAGIAKDDLEESALTITVRNLITVLGGVLQNGWDSSLVTGQKFYRVLGMPVPRTPGLPLIKTYLWITRAYLATQRRRITPH